MREYYYVYNNERFGPFSFDEMCTKRLPPQVKIWYKGLSNWIDISEVSELSHLCHITKPPRSNSSGRRWANPKKFTLMGIIIILVLAGVFAGGHVIERIRYKNIVRSAFVDPDVDFSLYLEKYYRDIEFCGVIPTRPKQTIIKFADLDKYGDTKHIHAISYGYQNDEIIEIYVNPSSWKNCNEAKKYWLMYHELSHDILNVDDLENLPQNEGKLMYPFLDNRMNNRITMDDFIESFHQFMEEYQEK